MNAKQVIQTRNLTLLSVSVDMAKAAAAGDHAALALLLDAHVPKDWPPPIMADAQENLVTQLQTSRFGGAGLAWYLVLRNKKTLIGFAGFKGLPREGRIDIGYAVLDAHQKQGYATEAVNCLTNWAFLDPRVLRVVGETLPGLTPSIRVLEKCGYSRIGEDAVGFGGEEGVIQYEITREKLFGV